MKILALVLLTALPALCEDWTVAGKDYHNIKVTDSDALTVSVTYDGGIGHFNISDLSPELQAKLKYDPNKAKAILAQEAEGKAVAEAHREFAATCETKYVQIVQVLPDGLLVSPMIYQGLYGYGYYRPSAQMVFIHSKFAHVVDGDYLTVRVYRSGEYSYQTALGTVKTVEEWIAPPKEAFEASN